PPAPARPPPPRAAPAPPRPGQGHVARPAVAPDAGGDHDVGPLDHLTRGAAHAMMGMTLGPVTGRALAEHVLGRPQSLALPMCDPARYFTDAPPRAVASGTHGRAADPAVPAA
ncbi:MAG: hypothetical protein ACKOGJ_09925, partial [Phycisphaerales bacterium]